MHPGDIGQSESDNLHRWATAMLRMPLGANARALAEPPLGGTVDAITRTLSAYAVELSHADLTEQAVHGMRQRLVDSVAWRWGRTTASPRLSRASCPVVAGRAAGARPAIRRRRLSGDGGVRGHGALDFNDTYFAAAGGHPRYGRGRPCGRGRVGAERRRRRWRWSEIFCVLGEARPGSASRRAPPSRRPPQRARCWGSTARASHTPSRWR